MDTGYHESIGEIIKKKRKQKGLTLQELGKRINVNKGTISRWENNQINNMGIDKAKLLCAVLDLPPAIFIEGKDLSNVAYQEITAEEFKFEVINLLYRTKDFTEQEKQILTNNIDYICSTNQQLKGTD